MSGIQRLSNPIRQYAWGSRTALAELMGRATPTAEPEAELWMGAHASAPSQVETRSGPVALDDTIRDDPKGVLGAEVARRFGDELPFLFKVLAPERALSIQAHPSEAQARNGFAREQSAGVPLDDPRRCYRDPHAKPELVCALSEFDALCGFLSRDEIDGELARLGPAAEVLRAALTDGHAAFLRSLLMGGLDGELEQALVAAAEEGGGPAWRWVAELVRQYPGDPGVLAPLFLNHLRLAPGEALFLPAGELHAYLRGVAVELMGNSDNVLRGGLTPKHVDVSELLATLSFQLGAPAVLMPRQVREGVAVFETPARQFELSLLTPRPGLDVVCDRSGAVEILLCVAGRARLSQSVAGEGLELAPGQAALVRGDADGYTVAGKARLFRAGVPL